MSNKRKQVKNSKALLEEATMRRWSTIAGTPLTEKKLKEISFVEEEKDEEDFPEDDKMGMEMGDQEEPVDMDQEEPVEVPAVDTGEETLVKDLVSAIAGAIEDVSGIPVEVEGGVEDEVDVEVDDEKEPEELEEPTEEPKDPEEPVDDLQEKKLEDKKEEKLEKNLEEKSEPTEAKKATFEVDDEMVAEIAKRVASRLLQESAKSKKVVKK